MSTLQSEKYHPTGAAVKNITRIFVDKSLHRQCDACRMRKSKVSDMLVALLVLFRSR